MTRRRQSKSKSKIKMKKSIGVESASIIDHGSQIKE